jgi:hypothetical protein
MRHVSTTLRLGSTTAIKIAHQKAPARYVIIDNGWRHQGRTYSPDIDNSRMGREHSPHVSEVQNDHMMDSICLDDEVDRAKDPGNQLEA